MLPLLIVYGQTDHVAYTMDSFVQVLFEVYDLFVSFKGLGH